MFVFPLESCVFAGLCGVEDSLPVAHCDAAVSHRRQHQRRLARLARNGEPHFAISKTASLFVEFVGDVGNVTLPGHQGRAEKLSDLRDFPTERWAVGSWCRPSGRTVQQGTW